MSSVECLRELINERLTTAAEEIFVVFQKTIVQYEEEIDRQRRLLDIVWKPEIKLHRIELPQQHVCKEGEVLSDQQLCNQERNPNLDQEDPEPPQIKQEQEEFCTSLGGEQLILKQETETFMLNPTFKESEDQTLDLSPDETQSAAVKEHVVSMSVKSLVVPEPNSDDQLLPHNSHVAESQDHKGDSGSNRNAETKAQNRHRESKNHTYYEDNSTTLKTHKLPQQHVCKEEEVLVDQQLCNQERNFSLDQEDPEPPQIKEEQEELYTSLDTEQVVLKQETETFMLTPTFEEGDNNKDQTLDLSPDETHNSNVAASQDRKGGKHEDSGSTRNAQLKPNKRLDKSKSHIKNEDNSTSLKIHSNTYTGKKSLKCDSCGKTFKCKSKLHTHMRVHTGEKPFSCNTCGRRFSEKAKVNRHMRTHTGEKPHSCNSCEKRFSRLGALKVHMRVHTGEKPYPCNTCGKTFSQLDTLKVHLRIHTGEKPYPCNTCGKRFSYLGALKVHMRVHTGEKPYACNTCGKTFSQLDTLKVHLRIHTGEKPYPCNTCGKRFSHLETLKVHMRIHTGEKPYPCNTCEKKFSDLGSLKVHMRIHTGVKPYPCKICGKRFNEKTTMKRHIRIHTGEKPYSCKTCGKDFKRRYNLKIHMRIHAVGNDSVRCQT
ncbi:zinc finger protein 79-like isoform X1 [Thunnus thynnus]|uniref:zinc finger protein 79-like isoform X1 n=1 Tax=Thunnus thynnus TaxID=8237 RepID=UPI003527E2EE